MTGTYEERGDEIFISPSLDDDHLDSELMRAEFITLSTGGFAGDLVRLHLKHIGGEYCDTPVHIEGLFEALIPMNKNVVIELGEDRIQRFQAADWREITGQVTNASPVAVDIRDMMGEYMASIMMGRQFCVHWNGPHEESEHADDRTDGGFSRETEESYGDDAETAT